MNNPTIAHERGGGDIDIDIPDIDVEKEMRNMRKRLPIFVVALLVVVVIFLLQALPAFYADWQWFKSMGQPSVFTTRITARLGLFFLAGLIFFLLYMVNILIARRLSPPGRAGCCPRSIYRHRYWSCFPGWRRGAGTVGDYPAFSQCHAL